MRRILPLLILLFAMPAFATPTPTPTVSPSETPTAAPSGLPTSAPAVTDIYVDPQAVTISVGVMIQLFGKTTPTGTAAEWTTSNDKVARLDPGAPITAAFVTGVAAGTATITATVNGFSSSCVVTVVPPVPTATPTGGVMIR